MGYVFPSKMFLVDSDLTPLEENFDAFLEGLTSWVPEMTETGLVEPEMIAVKGADYKEAFDKANNLFARNLWRDSLPIVPPTQDVVDWILTGTDMDPAEVLGSMRPRGGIATVRAVAVALAMAGGRPEYLPLTVAMVKATADDRMNMQSWSATTNSCFPAYVVDGPMARDIRLASGYGLLGPNPSFPAGGAIGRAMRLILQDIGGATPGNGTMAVFGGMRTVNAVFAEDYEDLPEGWTSLSQDMGYELDQNVVTITVCNSMVNVLWDFGDETGNNNALRAMAGNMAAPNPNRLDGPITAELQHEPNLTTGLALLPHSFVESLASVNGYTKDDVRQFLWDNSKVPYETVVSWGYEAFMERGGIYKPGDMVAAAPRADQITLVVTGGSQGGHGYWMAPFMTGHNTAVEIELPANWDDLLFQAEIDLGPIPASS